MPPSKIKDAVSLNHLQKSLSNLLVRHLYILLLVPLSFIIFPLLQSGISITSDFPYLDTSHFAINRLWLWVEKGSIDGFEFLSRLPIIVFWYMLGQFGINSEISTKLMVLLGFALSSFSFYFSFVFLFKSKFTNANLQLKLSAILGSLFYAYNVWSVNRVHHWYIWIAYSVLPLFFVSVIFSFKNPKNWKYILTSIFLWSFASSTPHMAVFYGLVFVTITIGFILNYLIKNKTSKRSVIHLVRPVLSIIIFYSLVNMYWIYPYIMASQTQMLAPNYELTDESLDLLSKESNFLNTFRVMSYWLNSDVEKFSDNSLLFSLWILASFVIPVVAFSALLLRKSIKYPLIFSSAALIVIFLAMGTQAPFNYFGIAVATPILTKFVWLFRDPDKWSFLIAFAYSFLIGIVSYKILIVTINTNNNYKKKIMITGSFLFLLVGSIFLSSYPFYKSLMNELKPVLLPAEFDKLNAYLSTINTDKVFIIPYPLEETDWKTIGSVGDIYQMYSIKPSIEGTEYNLLVNNYYNYLKNLIVKDRIKNIDNLIYPFGTSYLIFHNDTWSKMLRTYNPENLALLKKLFSLNDLKNIENLGFYKVFKIGSKDNNSYTVGEANIASENLGVFGGLDAITSLNALPSFNSINSSIVFLDQIIKNSNFSMNFDKLILDRESSYDKFGLSFVDDKYIVAPFDATNHYEPAELWSKSRIDDPIHGEFHPQLESLGIENWDFDYGKGLVMTKALGTNLSIPVEIKNHEGNNANTSNNANASKNDNYSLFMRYMKNQKGGTVKVYFDNKLINVVDTFDKLSNKFVWEKIGSLNLTNGKHTLTLQNVAGFNAVNIFALVPPDEMNRLNKETTSLLDKTRAIYLMEAESNFYGNNNTINIGSSHNLFDNHSIVNVVNNGNSNKNNFSTGNTTNNSTFTKIFRGQFKVPQNTDFVGLQFFAKQNPDTASSYSIKNLEIIPAYKNYTVFSSDFENQNANENKNVSAPKSLKSDWINYQKDILSTQETSPAIDGNKSLKVDIKQGNFSHWGILSTDFIPVSAGANYNETFDIFAKDVKQLHSKVFYFDSAKNEIKWDFAFAGRDGSFEQRYNKSLSLPLGTKYIKLQMWVSPNPKMNSSYLLDNVKLEEVVNASNISNNNSTNALDGQTVMKVNSDYPKTNDGTNSTHYLIQTKPFPVKENHIYNYTITADAKNVSSLGAIASFKKSSDIIENNRYGNDASNGGILSLSPGSEVFTKLDILKPLNYVIAIRAKTCETCTFLRVSMEKEQASNNGNENNNNNTTIKTSNISLKNNMSGAKWLWLYANSTYPLKNGTYDLKIYSNGQADLDSVVLYSVGNANSSNTFKNNKNLVFNPKVSSPAQIADYKKINPTKHILKIENATRPFMISFAEAYDPLWVAYSDDNNNQNNNTSNFKTSSVPLYSIVNGFYINKTGDYTLTIEYQPQKWLIQGGTVSVVTVIIILIILAVGQERIEIHLKNLSNRIRSNVQTNVKH
jgi:hypothetical protein